MIKALFGLIGIFYQNLFKSDQSLGISLLIDL